MSCITYPSNAPISETVAKIAGTIGITGIEGAASGKPMGRGKQKSTFTLHN